MSFRFSSIGYRVLQISLAITVMGGGYFAARALPSDVSTPHSEWCKANRDKNISAKEMCADHPWCDEHWADDRISKVICDPYRSRADLKKPVPNIQLSNLASFRNLKGEERISNCLAEASPFNEGFVCHILKWGGYQAELKRSNCLNSSSPADPCVPPGADDVGVPVDHSADILPKGMGQAKLGLRAHISEGPFPTTVVQVGIASPTSGEMTVRGNDNGIGPRQTKSFALNENEIGQIIATLSKSHFWQLPDEPKHLGATDGEMAAVEVSVAGWKHHVGDSIGNSETVDLSILVHALGEIIGQHQIKVASAENR